MVALTAGFAVYRPLENFSSFQEIVVSLIPIRTLCGTRMSPHSCPSRPKSDPAIVPHRPLYLRPWFFFSLCLSIETFLGHFQAVG